MREISFSSCDIRFKIKAEKDVSEWLKNTAGQEGYKIKKIKYFFCSDSYLAEINDKFLHHKSYTDIVTFPYCSDKAGLEAEIFISIERVKENALKFKQDENLELRRVIVHGLLHLIGFTDKTKSEKEAMRRREDLAISQCST